MKINQTITIPDSNSSEQQQYIKKKVDEIVELKSYLQRLEVFHNELMAMETLQQFNEMIMDWNIRLDSTRTEYDSQFGETQGEYKGYCPQAYLHIGIGYGTLASQTWSEKKYFLEGRNSEANMIQTNRGVGECSSGGRHHLKTCREESKN